MMDIERLKELKTWTKQMMNYGVSEGNDLITIIDLEIARQNVLILKGSFICENCKHIVKSEVTNKLFCAYHSEGEHQYETYKGDYCSYFDRME